MQLGIRSPKDFWIGLIYIAIGGAAFWLGWNYRFGTAGRMGPGYFPLVLAGTLGTIGFTSLVLSFIRKSEALEPIAWKPLLLILTANVLFGFLIIKAGLLVALLVLCLVSAAASEKFRFEWSATFGLAGLIAFCVLVFVKGLGLPMPIIGPWLEPLMGAR